MRRRTFLAALSGAFPATVALAGCSRTGEGSTGETIDATPAETSRREGFGVQLYTLRSVITEDVDRTLSALAEMGYRTVELAGTYGLGPRELRAKLDAAGLRAASSHHSVADVRGDWSTVLAGAQELGQDLVVVPSIPGDERTAEALTRLADEFDQAAAAARQAGLRFGYHNHDWEFAPLPDGRRPMDLLLEHTDPGLVDWQMDVYWTVHGGADPERYLDEAAGRVTSVHVKDRAADGRMVDVGDGVIDFSALLAAADARGLMHAFVEHDSPGDALDSVRRSIAALERA